MIMAAGLGTRLRPLTYEMPKPMVPVLDRPVMAYAVALLEQHGITEAIANLHHFPETIRSYFGERIAYSVEEEALGTAGGVRNCAEFFGEQTFLVISGDALTDVDLGALVARHRQAGGVATLAVKKVADASGYGVVLHDAAGRITGFQEKPAPAEALSELGNCGIYVFEPAIFDHFPDRPFADWAEDVFPALLERDVPFHIHEIDEYWCDVGSFEELRQGTFDVLEGRLSVEIPGERLDQGLFLGERSSLEGVALIEPPVWIGRDVEVGAYVRLQGPLVVGDRARIGDAAALRDSIVFPGAEIAAETILVGAITSQGGVADALRPNV